jgi:hypothetical protein
MRKLSVMLLMIGMAPLVLSVSSVSTASAAVRGSALVIATGTVTNASGHAASGAVVRLYAWPSDRVLQHLRPGQTVPRKLVATTKVGSAGTYALRVPPAKLRSADVSSGYANLEADSGTASWSFTWKTAGDSPVVRVHPLHFSPATCSGWVYQRQIKRAWATVGQSYILHNATHVKQKFVYGKGQSSSLGLGISPSGKVGTFTAGGTESESTNTKQGFPTFGPSNVLYRTLFRMARYYVFCARGGRIAPQRKITKWMVRSNGWFGGDAEQHPKHAPHTPSWACAPEQKGGDWHTDREKAKAWSFGLNVAAVNFNGQAQTGYSSSAEIDFSFRANRRLCGTTSAPSSAKQLVVKR